MAGASSLHLGQRTSSSVAQTLGQRTSPSVAVTNQTQSTILLEAREGETAESLSARILSLDDEKVYPNLRRIIVVGRDAAAPAVKQYADRQKWPKFKRRYPHQRIDYALIGSDVAEMSAPARQPKEARSHVFARASEDALMRLFLEGAKIDAAKPVCRFWNGPELSPAEVVEALTLPDWVEREIDATKARIDAWKGDDEVVLVPTISDLHFYSPACGVWSDLKSVAESKLAHVRYFKRVIERLNADAAVNLGDLGYDYCPRHWSQSLDNEREARLMIEDVVYASLKVPLMMVPGNHDGGWSSPSGFGDRFNRARLGAFQNVALGTTGDYGYFDLAAKKTRLFFVSTAQAGNGGGRNIRDDQLAFMRKAVAETPDGWAALFFSHDCLHESCGRWDEKGWKVRSYKNSPGYVGLRRLLSETIRGRRLKLQGIMCGDSHFDLDWTDPESSIRYVITQGYGGCGASNYPKDPAVATGVSFKPAKQMLIDVAALKPSTGEWRVFRVGAGGAARDR